MDLSHIIVGSIVTEKSERLKADRNYTLKVAPNATKVDVQNALKKHFNVDVVSVRAIRVIEKTRAVGPHRTFTKRPAFKKMIVTLDPKSKPLDIAQFTA